MSREERKGACNGASSRREFLRLSATVAAAAAAGSSSLTPALGQSPQHPVAAGRGNTMPGRIVLYHDPLMEGHLPDINRDRVAAAVHHGVRLLTGIDDTAAAFESLFPGLHSGSTIAIKPNCLAWNDSRWEVVRGIVSGLALMLAGTYDVSQVTIYEVQTYLPDHGYLPGEFTFNSNTPFITSTYNCSSTYYVYGDHRMSNHVLNSDYVINVPVLKAHNVGYPAHEITTAFKNHYGSICPSSLCNNTTGMLTVNADSQVRNKTCLVVTSAIRGTYQGGPWEPPLLWNTFPETTPNMLFLTTDPVSESYWARDIINTERATHGWDPFGCPWIEESAADPYTLGVSNPDQMSVVYYDPAAGIETPTQSVGGTFLAPNRPNPFVGQTTLRFRLARASHADLAVLDPSGRVVRRLTQHNLAAGYTDIPWDGRDEQGQPVAAGIYFARLVAGGTARTRRMTVAR